MKQVIIIIIKQINSIEILWKMTAICLYTSPSYIYFCKKIKKKYTQEGAQLLYISSRITIHMHASTSKFIYNASI